MKGFSSLSVVAAVVFACLALVQPAGAEKLKVTICHKPGRPAEKTLILPQKAAERHMNRHGDIVGPCAAEPIACAGLFDVCVDTDGTATPTSGLPDSAEVVVNDPLAAFPVALPNDSGLAVIESDGNGAWTLGVAGDDLIVEGVAFCATANRNGVFDTVDFADCVVLDADVSLVDGAPVTCDLEVGVPCLIPLPTPPESILLLTYFDENGNGAWDDGEDIVFDVNNNGLFD